MGRALFQLRASNAAYAFPLPGRSSTCAPQDQSGDLAGTIRQHAIRRQVLHELPDVVSGFLFRDFVLFGDDPDHVVNRMNAVYQVPDPRANRVQNLVDTLLGQNDESLPVIDTGGRIGMPFRPHLPRVLHTSGGLRHDYVPSTAGKSSTILLNLAPGHPAAISFQQVRSFLQWRRNTGTEAVAAAITSMTSPAISDLSVTKGSDPTSSPIARLPSTGTSRSVLSWTNRKKPPTGQVLSDSGLGA